MKQVAYTRKGGHDPAEPEEGERIDADEFVARVLVQIPDPRRHLVRYYPSGRCCGVAGPISSDGCTRWTRSCVLGVAPRCGSSASSPRRA
jgi:hypothetical protein